MTAFFIYLFKAGCWIAVWWLIYHLFLRKETFYAFNRIYLMTGLAASFLISLMKIHYPVEVFMPQPSIAVAENAAAQAHSINIYSILFYFYIFGVIFLIMRQLLLLLKINGLIRSVGYTIVDNYRLVDSPEIKMPFSFFNCIFVNLRQISEEERKLILAHERSHISQLHRIDLTVTESACIFLWFNPFAWLYLHSVKENHEYLADEAVIRNGYSPACYRAALINQSLNTSVFPLVNSFTYYKFKRIFMMKKETSNPLKKLAVLLLIPAVCFFFWAFSEPEYRVTTGESPQQPVIPLLIIDGQESSASIEELDPNRIESVDVLKGESAVKVYGEKGKNGVVVVTTKKMAQSPKNQDKAISGANAMPPLDSLLVIIDGKESASSIKELNPEQIESVSVLKDNAAISVYGEKGKNGVVVITTKKANNPPESK